MILHRSCMPCCSNTSSRQTQAALPKGITRLLPYLISLNWLDKAHLYLESLVSANLLFIMPSAPTPPEKPFCRDTVLGYPLAESESCFCMMAREILLDPVRSRIEIISPESLRPSVSLSHGPSESGGRPKRPRRSREPGLMALRRPRKAFALLQCWQHRQLIFPNIQLRTCLMTMEMTLNRE